MRLPTGPNSNLGPILPHFRDIRAFVCSLTVGLTAETCQLVSFLLPLFCFPFPIKLWQLHELIKQNGHAYK